MVELFLFMHPPTLEQVNSYLYFCVGVGCGFSGGHPSTLSVSMSAGRSFRVLFSGGGCFVSSFLFVVMSGSCPFHRFFGKRLACLTW